MKPAHILFIVFSFIILASGCSKKQEFSKGFSVSPESASTDQTEINGFSRDSMSLKTSPGDILLTGVPNYRLVPIYKLNWDKKNDAYFTGENEYHLKYFEDEDRYWYGNYMPGLQAVYGFNMVNLSWYNVSTLEQKFLFDKPVLIKTIYFPSFTVDTIDFKQVRRNYYLISVYNEDTNKDKYLNFRDLRRFFYFDLNGDYETALIPENYSVISSKYDSGNDFMYIYAQMDENSNGQKDPTESIHVFWIDLKNPLNNGLLYKN